MNESHKPLIYQDHIQRQLPPGDFLDALASGEAMELVNKTVQTQPVAFPCAWTTAIAAGGFVAGRANALETSHIAGLLTAPTFPGSSGVIQRSGRFEALIAEWNVITTEVNGLTPGATYFLSPAIAGRISKTPPDLIGEYVIRIGRAISQTVMILDISDPIGL